MPTNQSEVEKPWPVVGVYSGGRYETAEVYMHEKHICGSHGFGLRDTDTCPRCEAERDAFARARAALAS